MEDRKRKRAELKAQKELEDAVKPKRKYRKKGKESLSLDLNFSPAPLPSITSPASNPRSMSPVGNEIGQEFEARSPTPSMGGYVYPK